MEEMFKKAANAMEKEDWGKLLEVADWLDIKPRNFDGFEKEIEGEIEKLKKLIENNKKTFSWAFFNCKTIEEKNQVVINFLQQMFGIIVDKTN